MDPLLSGPMSGPIISPIVQPLIDSPVQDARAYELIKELHFGIVVAIGIAIFIMLGYALYQFKTAKDDTDTSEAAKKSALYAYVAFTVAVIAYLLMLLGFKQLETKSDTSDTIIERGGGGAASGSGRILIQEENTEERGGGSEAS